MWHTMLKTLRENSGESMSVAANALGIPKGTYASYEYGTREPNIEMLMKISRHYKVTIDYLLENDCLKSNHPESMPFEQVLLQKYLDLSEDKRAAIQQLLIDTVHSMDDYNK